MSKFRKAAVGIIIVEILLIMLSNVLIFASLGKDDSLCIVEAKQVARRLAAEPAANIDLNEYETIIRIEPFDGSEVNYRYIVAESGGELYRIGYEEKIDYKTVVIVDVCLAVMFVFTVGVVIYIDRKVLKPFSSMTDMTVDLAKGNLTAPVKQEKSRYFGKFIWGMDMLRENLEESKRKELEYQKEKKTLVLSLSHDIKTPLSAIELYTKALKEGIYDC